MVEGNANTLDGSAFARVLARLMEARGIPANEEHALELAEGVGRDPEAFRRRLECDMGAAVGDLLPLARKLNLCALEMKVLALAYAFEEEKSLEEFKDPASERVVRPEELVEDADERPPDQITPPLRCRAGGKVQDGGCTRDATTWMFPDKQDYPLCEEHARALELSWEANEVEIAEDVTGEWLRIARSWGVGVLEQLAINAHEAAKQEALVAEARARLAQEIADAPRTSRKEQIADLTPEQDEKLRRLMRRPDEFNNAYTALEDHATGQMDEKSLRRTLAALVEERNQANEEFVRYRDELGIGPIRAK